MKKYSHEIMIDIFYAIVFIHVVPGVFSIPLSYEVLSCLSRVFTVTVPFVLKPSLPLFAWLPLFLWVL